MFTLTFHSPPRHQNYNIIKYNKNGKKSNKNKNSHPSSFSYQTT